MVKARKSGPGTGAGDSAWLRRHGISPTRNSRGPRFAWTLVEWLPPRPPRRSTEINRRVLGLMNRLAIPRRFPLRGDPRRVARASLPMRCSAQPIVDRDPIGPVGRRLDPDFVGAARVEGAQVGVELLSVSRTFSGCVDPGA